MRSSSLAMFGTAFVLLLTASGCRIEAHTQTQFEDKTQPAKTAAADWNGEAITIQNDGINPLSGLGGVEVKVDPAAKKISAEAVFAALADDDKKEDADESIRDALETFAIDEANGSITIRCGHGRAHGTSTAAGSGCKILRVTIPAGSAAQPLKLTVGNGNGSVRVGLAEAGDVPTVQSLVVGNNGLGEVSVRARPVKDATLRVFGERAVRVALPADFSTQAVTFTVDETDRAAALARIITTDFPGMADGAPYPPAGATAEAAKSLDVESKGPFDDNTITIAKF